MTMFNPTIGLLSKLGSIAQIMDEATRPSDVNFDLARQILADREVSQWLDEMHKQGLLAHNEQAQP